MWVRTAIRTVRSDHRWITFDERGRGLRDTTNRAVRAAGRIPVVVPRAVSAATPSRPPSDSNLTRAIENVRSEFQDAMMSSMRYRGFRHCFPRRERVRSLRLPNRTPDPVLRFKSRQRHLTTGSAITAGDRGRDHASPGLRAERPQGLRGGRPGSSPDCTATVLVTDSVSTNS